MGYDITSPANDRIKWLVRLRERRHRDAEGVFVLEGERLYRRALGAGLDPTVVFTDGTVDVEGDAVTVAPPALDKASYRERSPGVIAVFPQFDTILEHVRPSSTALLLIAEDIEKPGNLGAMMRTAAAVGIDALIAVESTVDPFNPNTVQASMGALFSLPLAVSSWDETAPWLDREGIELVAASPDGDLSLWEADLTHTLAIVIGAEHAGLSERAASLAKRLVVIPQADGVVDSFNASVAAAIVLVEAVRQRTVG
ncbi:MAG TPA: TrmH family RNA methyltransferase [Acidimicrobiia bacterium]|nr:TrmH family RNA methyltransferase [Acidimicrobiia bacterium]